MKPIFATIPSDKNVIQTSTWPKKKLADNHVEILKLCEYGCAYCSSNAGMHLKMRKQTIAEAVMKATGEAFNPQEASNITILQEGVLETLKKQLAGFSKPPGKGKTLVFSQLTDGFSPQVVNSGTTRRALEMLLDGTEYRIRVLTKNAIVGSPEWIRFFAEHVDRFVVGLSIGSLDDHWARKVERFTSVPSSRVKALRKLQDAEIPTYGMLCPMFPEVLEGDHIDRLIDAIRPERCEHVWAEPFNERQNWKTVRDCYPTGSAMRTWLTSVYEDGRQDVWSDYAATLYERVHDRAVGDCWRDKLRYLLYEMEIVDQDVCRFGELEGVLLQSTTAKEGLSKHPTFAKLQA